MWCDLKKTKEPIHGSSVYVRGFNRRRIRHSTIYYKNTTSLKRLSDSLYIAVSVLLFIANATLEYNLVIPMCLMLLTQHHTSSGTQCIWNIRSWNPVSVSHQERGFSQILDSFLKISREALFVPVSWSHADAMFTCSHFVSRFNQGSKNYAVGRRRMGHSW